MSQLPARKPFDKPLMTKKDHKMIIKGLKKRKYVEVSLQFLCVRKMNEEFMELVKETEDLLSDLCDDPTYGAMADYIWRQWQNSAVSDKPTVQPTTFKSEQLIVTEKPKGSRFSSKSKSLRLVHSKKLMNKKVEANPEQFERERQMERIQEMINSQGCSSSFDDGPLSFAGLFAPPNSPVSPVEEPRGRKRSHDETFP